MATDIRASRASELRRWASGHSFQAPRSAALLRGLGGAMEHDAPLAALLGPGWLDRPMAGVRLLAGVHDLVLAGVLPELWAHVYGDTLDAPPPADDVLWKLARQAIFDHPEQMRAALEWPVQQHGPERAAYLLSGLSMLAEPRVRVLELGACAGLILQADEYRWEGQGWTWGRDDSPVRFRAFGPPPPPGLEIVERAGCDLAPVDPGDPVMARRLHSFAPSELSGMHANLDAALKIAASRPPLVDKASALEWLERRLLESPPAGVHTVVWHCHVWQLLDQTERDGIRRALFAGAQRFPLTRISYEPYEVGGHSTLIVESFC